MYAFALSLFFLFCFFSLHVNFMIYPCGKCVCVTFMCVKYCMVREWSNRYYCSHLLTYKNCREKIFVRSFRWHSTIGWTFQPKSWRQSVKLFKCYIIPVYCKSFACSCFVLSNGGIQILGQSIEILSIIFAVIANIA